MRHVLPAAWIGLVVSGVWMVAIRPGHSKVASLMLVFSLLLVMLSLMLRGMVAIVSRRNQRIRGISEVATAALARDGFTVVDSLLGETCQDMIAIDDQQRVALCDLGAGGTVLRARIVAADQVQASSVVNRHGGTSLVVTLGADQRREFVFAARTPITDDRPDEKEQARITDSVRWWCERLSGRRPTGPFQVSHRVGVRAYGQAFDAALERAMATHGIVEVPDARVVSK